VPVASREKAEGVTPRKVSLFGRFARATSRAAGKPITFLLAVLLIVAWAAMGPMLGYSEGWQLVVNTTTTIITFLMVFLMQSTQNRDTEALQLKIDELIRAVEGADNAAIALDEAEEDELKEAREKYSALAKNGAAGEVAGAAAGAAAKAASGAASGAADVSGAAAEPHGKGAAATVDVEQGDVKAQAAVAVTPRSSRRRGGRAPRR
jgi:low affinity Fe/Cu permease